MTDADRIAELERQLAEAREDADKAWAQAKGATKTRDALQVKLINMANERDSLEKDLAGVRETISAVRKRAEAAEKEANYWKETALTIQTNLSKTKRDEWLRGHTEGFEDNGKALDLVVAKHDAALARVAELERLLAHARETAAENLEDKRVIQARCAELEKKHQLAATDAFRVGQAYHEQSKRMRAAEARIAELESQNADLDEEVANNDAERGEALEKLGVSESRCRALKGALEDLVHLERRTDCNERKCGSCSTCRARAALVATGGTKEEGHR